MLKILRVVTVLLDKQEIGPLIIDKISLDVFRTLHHMFQVLFSCFAQNYYTRIPVSILPSLSI